MVVNGVFLHSPGDIRYDLGQKTQRPQIFYDIRGFGGDQQEVQVVFERLIDVSDRVRLHVGVLFGMSDEFGKGRQETLHTQSIHFYKLTRDEGLALSRGNGCRQNHLQK